MLLKTVKIENFRCFRDIEVALDETTVIIGENNSGKTSFLEAIRLALSRNISRKGAGLEEYDYHLGSETAQPGQADELKITLDFVAEADMPDDLVQALGDVLVFDDDGQIRHVIIQIKSSYDSTMKDFISDWGFLDCTGNSLPPKTKRPQVLNSFLQLNPIFYLSALRDAAREFHGKSAFWSPFLRDPGIDNEIRENLQEQLGVLNQEVLAAHSSLQSVKDYLAKVQHIVASGQAGAVDIEALPGRVTDLLSKTQINIAGHTGAKLPLHRHGSGTQSLAVIFLFEAFLATMLSQQYEELSSPLLTLEEPEAHLHPCAIRTLQGAIETIPGQKIVATHSGDLLARIPLRNVRRFCRKDGTVTVRQLQTGSLTPEEERKIDFYLRSCRGELLFARCWILGEGESEYWIYNEIAQILGHDLDLLGIRIVTYQNSGVRPIAKVAIDFGISWVLAADGDQQGQQDKATCEDCIEGSDASVHISIMVQPNIEVLLCEEGFGAIYENHISPQKAGSVTAQQGSREYWTQVVKAQGKTPKPDVIREVTDMIRNQDAAIPDFIVDIINAAITLTEGQS